MFSLSLSPLTSNHRQRRANTSYTSFACLYDALLGNHFFPLLCRAFEHLVCHYRIRFAAVADMACGTGAFVRFLRQHGVPIVYGVDRSLAMLRLAVAKNADNGARFLRQDFAGLQLPQPVELITCNFDSLNYLLTTLDLLRALRRFYANLKPGGHLIFDIVTDRPPWQGPRPRVERVAGSGVSVVRVMRWDPRRCVQTNIVSVSHNGSSQLETHVQRGYPIPVVVDSLVRAGFTLRGVHDFQTLNPATARTARAVYVARVL